MAVFQNALQQKQQELEEMGRKLQDASVRTKSPTPKPQEKAAESGQKAADQTLEVRSDP